jgi:hypothetical protein
MGSAAGYVWLGGLGVGATLVTGARTGAGGAL